MGASKGRRFQEASTRLIMSADHRRIKRNALPGSLHEAHQERLPWAGQREGAPRKPLRGSSGAPTVGGSKGRRSQEAPTRLFRSAYRGRVKWKALPRSPYEALQERRPLACQREDAQIKRIRCFRKVLTTFPFRVEGAPRDRIRLSSEAPRLKTLFPIRNSNHAPFYIFGI